ncbi:class I SAM-dependent methyltransferase [Cumulibacter soli]|uniref:class I SAM-dependent methyltransferase n=1 Tax=Cumulibacter soli TaxID=2546344 RepID=UPI0010681A87|nr:class I SAM-dependent methyltransferase [Cumulibacter soli]
MLDSDNLGVMLLAIATGYPDRVRNILQTSDQLDDEERQRLWDAFASTEEPSQQARALGNAIRQGGSIDFLSNECYRLAFWLGDGLDDLRGNALFDYFATQRTTQILDKWVHYFPIYSRYFERFRGRSLKMLEIGIFRGGSMSMWENYFGEGLVLTGVDIDPSSKIAAGPDRTVVIGDQSDPEFLRKLHDDYGPFDIVLDDGGHTMEQQIATTETLFPLLNEGGVLLVEDCHTSYWPSYGGGHGKSGTFIEWAKAKVDTMHGYHDVIGVDPIWTDEVDGIHFHDSIVVFEKDRRFAPFAEQVGTSEFLMHDRGASVTTTELLATRDAAVQELEELREQVSKSAADEDLRLLTAEIERLRPLALESDRVIQEITQERDSARETVRQLRGGRDSWISRAKSAFNRR